MTNASSRSLVVWAWAGVASLLFAAAGGAANVADSAGKRPTSPWPEAPTAEPKTAEWDAAEPFPLSRVAGTRASACFASRLREWILVRCPALRASAMTYLGGESADTNFSMGQPDSDGGAKGAQVVIPLRAKQRRVIMFWGLGPGYDGRLTVVPALVLQTDWSGSAPMVALYDAVHEPVRTAQSERREKGEPRPRTIDW